MTEKLCHQTYIFICQVSVTIICIFDRLIGETALAQDQRRTRSQAHTRVCPSTNDQSQSASEYRCLESRVRPNIRKGEKNANLKSVNLKSVKQQSCTVILFSLPQNNFDFSHLSLSNPSMQIQPIVLVQETDLVLGHYKKCL